MIHQSHQKDSELVEALTEPVGECLQQAFRNDPETYGDHFADVYDTWYRDISDIDGTVAIDGGKKKKR